MRTFILSILILMSVSASGQDIGIVINKNPGELSIVHIGDPAIVKTYSVRAIGGLGRKLQQGDGRTPEGMYRVTHLNPNSKYVLSIGINYPNAVDRARSKGASNLGGDIFIHGDSVTAGCIAMGADITEIYAIVENALKTQKTIPVLIVQCKDPRRNERIIDLMWDKYNRSNDPWYLNECLYMMNLNETYIYFLATGYMRDDSHDTHYISDETFAKMTHNDFMDLLDNIEK